MLQVDVTAGYGKQTIFRDVRFTLSAGERLGLLGSSGAGKSTLLLTLLGLLEHRGGWAKGQVLFAGKDLLTLSGREARKVRGREIALVPQSPTSALNPALSILGHFEAVWAAHRKPDKPLLTSRLYELAQRVGLPADMAFMRRKPGQISVGQAQRCALALALLHKPALIIADEPTSALDPVNQTEVLELLRRNSEEEGAALLFVSHDLISVFRLCSGVAVLSGGQMLPRIAPGDIASNNSPELRLLINALPLPVDLLLQHAISVSNHGTKVPGEGTLLTLPS